MTFYGKEKGLNSSIEAGEGSNPAKMSYEAQQRGNLHLEALTLGDEWVEGKALCRGKKREIVMASIFQIPLLPGRGETKNESGDKK